MDLTDAYANAAHIPEGTKYPDRWAQYAATFRSVVPGRFQLPFGPGKREVYDIFGVPEPLGTVIFVHGGYWKAFDRTLWSHLSAGALASEWAFALMSYDLCPDVRISAITAQVARAVDAIAAQTKGPIVLTGHSAGGHLVARLACGDVHLDCRDRIAHVAPISLISDLAPLMQTDMNADLRIDEAEALAESPRHKPKPAVPVSLWVGRDERPAFVQQSRWLAEAWKCPLHVITGRHHFDIIELLSDPDSRLMETLTRG